MTKAQFNSLTQAADDDAPIVVFNDGAFYEWYGTEEVTLSRMVVKKEIIYILMGSVTTELGYVNVHYKLYKQGKIEATDKIPKELKGDEMYNYISQKDNYGKDNDQVHTNE